MCLSIFLITSHLSTLCIKGICIYRFKLAHMIACKVDQNYIFEKVKNPKNPYLQPLRYIRNSPDVLISH